MQEIPFYGGKGEGKESGYIPALYRIAVMKLDQIMEVLVGVTVVLSELMNLIFMTPLEAHE